MSPTRSTRARPARRHTHMHNIHTASHAWLLTDQVYSRKARAAPLVHQARRELEARLDAALGKADAEAATKFTAGDIAGRRAVSNIH